ncbi:hypothetical protein L7F22_012772 [Adiantum nelumboides]|nr:hypothetical protein [Adiantum nelumboides]
MTEGEWVFDFQLEDLWLSQELEIFCHNCRAIDHWKNECLEPDRTIKPIEAFCIECCKKGGHFPKDCLKNFANKVKAVVNIVEVIPSSSSEGESLVPVKDADSPKDAWDNLIAFNATNTRARKIQLKNELNTIKKGDLSVNDYTLKIKALCESLYSIGVAVDDDDKVKACLRGLGNAHKQFKTNICTRENILHFLELPSLLVVEEKSLIDDATTQTRRNTSK